MKNKKKLTIFSRISLLVALNLIVTISYAQQLEVGAFLGKYRNFGYGNTRSTPPPGSFQPDWFRTISSFKEGGGIESTYYFNNNWGVRSGLRYVPAEYTAKVWQNLLPVLSMDYTWNIKSRVFQVPVGIVCRLPMSKGEKHFKVFLDATADIRHFNVDFESASLTIGPDRPQRVFQSYSFNQTSKIKVGTGADFGFGLTPFKCKNIELNALYHLSFTSYNVLDYESYNEYINQNNEPAAVAGKGTIRLRPDYVMAQLVYYFISR